MSTFQVLVRGKDNEPEAYEIGADKWATSEDLYCFYQGEKPIAWFQSSQVIGIIEQDSQEEK